MRRFLLLVLALASSPAAAQGSRAIPSGCQEDYLTCKEDCSIEYGGSKRTLSQLTRCLGECQETQAMCAERHSSLKAPAGVTDERARRGGKDDPYTDPEPGRGKATPEAEARPAARAAAPAPAAEPVPARGAESAGVTRQGVYRASEAEEAAEPESAPFPELEPEEDPKPAPVAKPAPAPAPKKEPVKPAPVVASSEEEKDPLLDEEPPPPPAAKKPAPAPSRPSLPPEPKKDISEWDPDGD